MTVKCNIVQKRVLYGFVIINLIILFCIYAFHYDLSKVFNVPRRHRDPVFKVANGAIQSLDIQSKHVHEASSSIHDTLDDLNDVIYDGDYDADYDIGDEAETRWNPDYLVADGALPAHRRRDGGLNTTALKDILAGLNHVIYGGDYDDGFRDDYWVTGEDESDSEEASNILEKAWTRLQGLWNMGTARTRPTNGDSQDEQFLKWSVNESKTIENNSSTLLKKAVEYRDKLNKVLSDFEEINYLVNRTTYQNISSFSTSTLLPALEAADAGSNEETTSGNRIGEEINDNYPAYEKFMKDLASAKEIVNVNNDMPRRILSQLKKGAPVAKNIINRIIRANNGNKDFIKPPSTTESGSPCWRTNEKLFCQPAGYLLGFQKCATKDLFYRLTGHPQLVFGTMKQNQHFVRDGTMFSLTEDSRQHGIMSLVMGHSEKTAIIFVRSPPAYTIPYPQSQSPHTYKMIVRAQVLHEVNPEAKFIVIMRNPVDAAFSAFGSVGLFKPTRMKSLSRWAIFVKEVLQQYNNCIRQKDIFNCNKLPPKSMTRIDVNLLQFAYIIQLSHWMKVFPREQFYFIKTEDYADVQKRRKILEETFHFLGGRNLTTEELRVLAAMKRLDLNSVKYNSPQLLEGISKTRTLLNDFFQPFNSALAGLLEDERFLWND